MKLNLERNLGPWDRLIRVAVGLYLIVSVYRNVAILPSYGIWLLYLLGLSQVVEGAAGY